MTPADHNRPDRRLRGVGRDGPDPGDTGAADPGTGLTTGGQPADGIPDTGGMGISGAGTPA